MEVGHEVTRQEEGSRGASPSNVLFDLSLPVDVRNVRELPVGSLGDIQETGENNMRHILLLRYVGDVLALGDFGVGVGRLPVVGNEENGMRSFDGVCEGGFGVEVGLGMNG